ncbi:MAG: glycosyltransferase, partial [Candidatus Eiseniibacteriota bacterium]
QGASFFRECRRVLENGGRVRVATPDLDFLVDVYSTDWRRNMPEWSKYGYEWIANRAEQLNLVMREWEHRWLYNEEELVRLASMAGLAPLERCQLGESTEPRFRGIDYREGSTLIYEFVKGRPAPREDEPLVSIVMTAFNPRYFETALESALAQTYRNLEVVIGDDRCTNEIERMVAAHPDSRIRYQHNPANLGEKQNLIECFARARGEYVKFLNDDDLLLPECVARMVRCLNQHPEVTLVTSHRQRIDVTANALPEIAPTRRPVQQDSIIDGVSAIRAMLESGLNFIGEPSTTMFRRADLAPTQPNILSFAGREAIGTVDVTMWTNLLSRGDLIYLTDTLSSFRIHPEQAQKSADYLEHQAGAARQQILFDARRMGLLGQSGPLTLGTRPLAGAPGHEQQVSPAATPRPAVPGTRVSVVIPLWNNVEYSRKCLAAISKHTPAGWYEIVIVDNGSTDGTRAMLAALPPGAATVISNAKNLGFAKACNQGAQAATGEYVLFLNNDTEPESGWIEPLIAVLDADASVAAVGSKLLYPDRTIQHAGVVIIEDRSSLTPLVAKHLFHQLPGDSPEANRIRTYQALTAACLLVRRSSFDEVGGFDEGYWNGYEDVDLCFKLQARRWKLVYQPDSAVIHHESKSGPERFSKADENVRRLQERWAGKIAPDVIREQDGKSIRTDSSFPRAYDSPLAPAKPPSAATAASPGLVSLVMLTCNQLRYTRECLESIQKHTPEPHEIIFVDNGSSDGTVKWLKRQAHDHAHYRLIENPSNLGFARGCNQGIEAARGEYILLLNNDVLVTHQWLAGLIECLEREPHSGFAGPMTNQISGPQRVPNAAYPSGATGLDAYAAEFRERNRGRRIPMRRVVGFCMLFRRELVRTVGLLDERFGSGNFEDDDLCLRAAALGLTNVVAGDVFIHHHGSRTFAGNRMNFADAMTGNRSLYAAKWNAVPADSPLGRRVRAVMAVEQAAELHARGETAAAIQRIIEELRGAPGERILLDGLLRILIDSKNFTEAAEMLASMPAESDDPVRLALTGLCSVGQGQA